MQARIKVIELSVVRRVYPRPESWMLSDGDRYLLDQLGLHYTLHISIVSPEENARVVDDHAILIPDNNEARVVGSLHDFMDCGYAQYLTFHDFVDAHRGQIQGLVNDYLKGIDIHRPR